TVTGSSGVSSAGNLNQPMPGTLVATAPNQGRYLPPANVGAGSGVSTFCPAPVGQVSSPSSVVSQPLPDLAPTPSIGSTPSMPAQQPVMQASVPNTLGSLPPAPPPAAPA